MSSVYDVISIQWQAFLCVYTFRVCKGDAIVTLKQRWWRNENIRQENVNWVDDVLVAL